MATGDMILDLEGVDGESKDSVHKGKIEVESMSWGLSNASTQHTGGGGGVSRAAFSDLHCTKYTDKASANLFINCAKGKHHPKATLYIRKVGGGDKPEDYVKFTLTDVFITSFQTSHSSGGTPVMESLSLSYSKFHFEYFVQDDKGITKSAGDQTFNLKENKPS
jgi:type VI secretion system secreted protein Hcp